MTQSSKRKTDPSILEAKLKFLPLASKTVYFVNVFLIHFKNWTSFRNLARRLVKTDKVIFEIYLATFGHALVKFRETWVVRKVRQTVWNAPIQSLRNFKLKGNKYSIENYFLLIDKKELWFRPNIYLYSKRLSY